MLAKKKFMPTHYLNCLCCRSLFDWTLRIHGPRKQAIDALICSLCYINSRYLSYLLEWSGIRSTTTSRTDDSKRGDAQAPVTDDAKASWSAQLQPPRLTEAHLLTLGMAAQSEAALGPLIDSQLLTHLTKAITAFCVQHTVRMWETAESPAANSALVSELRNHEEFKDVWSQYQAGLIWHLSPDMAAYVLHFLADAARESLVKDWLGSPGNHAFWLALLFFLCNNQEVRPTCSYILLSTSHFLFNYHWSKIIKGRIANCKGYH